MVFHNFHYYNWLTNTKLMVTLGVAVYNNHCSHTLKRLITSNAEYYEIYFHKKVLFKKIL